MFLSRLARVSKHKKLLFSTFNKTPILFTKLEASDEAWIKDYSLGKLLILDKDKLDFTNNPEDLGIVIQSIEAEINGLFPPTP